MMFVVDNLSMRRIDGESMDQGVSGLSLMERAGSGAAEILLEQPDGLDGTTLIVVGKGNNGGDGLVVARRLHERGFSVQGLLLSADSLRGDAAVNLERARDAGLPLAELGPDPASSLRRHAESRPGRLVIDAVLGTGFTPPLREPLGKLCETLSELGRRVVALDCPSGLDGNDGSADSRCVRASLTISFGYPKWGLFLSPGRTHCGRIKVIDLGYPAEIVERVVAESESCALFVDEARARAWLPDRPVDAHKYRVGSVLVVGGSAGMSGAVSLACNAAYRAGAGLVEAMVPRSEHGVIDAQCVETLVHSMDESGGGGLHPEGLDIILERAARRSAVLVGPGGGSDLDSADLFLDLIARLERPTVVDADALNAFSRRGRELRFPTSCVLTPHSGELGRLLGCPADELDAERRQRVRGAAQEWGVVLLHKGAPSLIAAPDGRLAVIGSGGPGLATAGSGDVLAGVLVALLGSGVPPFEAAGLGAWLHGAAGDRAERVHGVAGVLARDLVDEVAAVIARLEAKRP